ncbi:hypothetical protein Agub_g8748 [Astrephomene gubernaculifera]|uniref:AB hydrolase-1 domain-containing protein n=1 Tax=Astrephomene gubernaculifera TaxID=47775 RepID=A0AAD3HNB8_9CHLO|nr:hypothetical protein Agub_g8748 [Astrephomene gubernaculifera]
MAITTKAATDGSMKGNGTSTIPYKRVKTLDHIPATSGALRSLLLLAVAPLIWASLVLTLARAFLSNPLGFFRRSRRPARPEEVPLPPPWAQRLAGLQHEMLDVGGGVRLHAVSFGRRPHLPLLLLLHGFPECWYSWRHLLAEAREGEGEGSGEAQGQGQGGGSGWLGGRYEVVALDMRGFGWSSKPEGISAYSLDALTSDIAGAVAALGRTSCTLLAHDWGGAVAWAAAGRYPGLVRALGVVAAPHWLLYRRNLSLQQAVRSSYIVMFQMPILPELLLTHSDAALLETLLLGRAGPASPRTSGAVTPGDVEVYKAALLQPGCATASLNYYRAVMLASMGVMPFSGEVERGLRRQLEMPVLVVWGAEDHALLVSNLKGVAEVAPLSEVHILPHCSHWVQSDQPQELSRVVREWLGE